MDVWSGSSSLVRGSSDSRALIVVLYMTMSTRVGPFGGSVIARGEDREHSIAWIGAVKDAVLCSDTKDDRLGDIRFTD